MLDRSDVMEWERRKKYLWAVRVREAVTFVVFTAYVVGIACGVVPFRWGAVALFSVVFVVNLGRRLLAERGIFSNTYRLCTIVLDVCVLSVVTYFTGGVDSFLVPLFFIQIVATAILAGTRLAVAMAILSSIALTFLGCAEWRGLLPPTTFLARGVHSSDGGYVVTFLATMVPLLFVVAYGMGLIGRMLHRAQAEMALASVTDEMTGLYNHRHFVQRLDDEIRRSQRYGHTTGLILIDLDHFKRVNDQHGHVVGDQALRHAADRLREQLRRTDLPARYGGEEFAVILPETPLAQAVLLADRLRNAVGGSALTLPSGAPLTVTLSAGVAAYPAAGLSGGLDLVRAADACLYRAKGEGRNRVCSTDGAPSARASA